MLRQEHDFIVKIEVAEGGAGSPASLLITDRNPSVVKLIELIPVLDPVVDEFPRQFLVLEIVLGYTTSSFFDAPSTPPPESFFLHIAS